MVSQLSAGVSKTYLGGTVQPPIYLNMLLECVRKSEPPDKAHFGIGGRCKVHKERLSLTGT